MHEFRKDVEGLRAIAVVAVILYHAGVPGFTGGYVGVDVFFVISGFLITGQLARDTDPSALRRIRHFYARRVRRIVPAATLTIVATLAGAALLQSALLQPTARDDAASAMFFFSNIRFAQLATDYFQQDAAPSLFQHFWSLSVEEQFYFIWPALMVAAATLGAPRRHAARIGVVAAVGLASFALCVRLTETSPVNAFFQLPMRAWELCAGAALALAATSVALSPNSRRAARATGLALIVAAIVLLDDNSTFPGIAALGPVLGATLVVLAGLNPAADADAGRVLVVRPMQLLGRYSYSLYLWHWPVLLLAGLRYGPVLTDWKRAVLLMLIVVLPIAVASYHVVEHPFRAAFTRRSDGQTLGMGAAILAVGAFAFVPYGAVAETKIHTDRAAPAVGALLAPTEFVPSNLRPELRAAHDFATDRDFAACANAFEECLAGDPDATRTVVLFGDSHARHWISAFDAAGRAERWRLVALTRSGCRSFVEPENDEGRDCASFRAQANAIIARLRPALVVLSNQASGYFAHDRAGFADGVEAALRALPDGTRSAVFAQTPIARENVPVCLSEHLRRTRACEPAQPEEFRDAMNAALLAATRQQGSTFIDIISWMCTPTRCPTIDGDVLVYRDRNHFTPEFTRSRIDELTAALNPLLAP